MVILQTSDDSATGTLHELAEVMRYERLETAELDAVYEKGKALAKTRRPAVLIFPPPLPDPLLQESWQEDQAARGWEAASFHKSGQIVQIIVNQNPLPHYVQFRKEKMSQSLVIERAESDATRVPPKDPTSLAGSSPPSARSAEEASRHCPLFVQPRQLGPWSRGDEIKTCEQCETVPLDVQKIVQQAKATVSTRQGLGQSKFSKIEAKHVNRTELKLPNHMPAYAAKCGFAAHDQTLTACIKRSDSDKPISSNLSEISFHQRFISRDVSWASVRLKQRGIAVKVGEHDDKSSVATSDSNIAGDPGQLDESMYSIIITPQHHGCTEVPLVKLEGEMKVSEFGGMLQNCHMSYDSDEHELYEIRSFETAKRGQPAVVPKLHLMSEESKHQEHMPSTGATRTKPAGFTNSTKDKKKTGSDIYSPSNKPNAPRPQLPPWDDPGIPGVGWEGQSAGVPAAREGPASHLQNSAAHHSAAHHQTLASHYQNFLLSQHGQTARVVGFHKQVVGVHKHVSGKGTRAHPEISTVISPRRPRSGGASTSPQNRSRAVGIVGMVPLEQSPPREKNSALVSWGAAGTTAGKITETEIVDYAGGSTDRSQRTGQKAAQRVTVETARTTFTQGSGILDDALEKLNVWVHEESEGESDGGSDTLEAVNTANALPARLVHFINSPRQKTVSDERLATPNTTREEALCAWEDSARKRESGTGKEGTATRSQHSRTGNSRRVSTQGSRLWGSPGRGDTDFLPVNSKHGREGTGQTKNNSRTPFSATSSRASRYMTGDSNAVHEYFAIRDPAYHQAQPPPRLSVVSFFHEPTPAHIKGTRAIMKGGKVRPQIFENPHALAPCDQVMKRTTEQEANLDRFLPVPMGEAAPKNYPTMLRKQGVDTFVMDWGSGMVMKDAAFDQVLDDDDEASWKKALHYYPDQKVPGSEVRKAEVRRRKTIRINPAVFEDNAIKLILERERILGKLQKSLAKISRGEADPEAAVRREVCNNMLDLRAFSVFVVESIAKWQKACGPKIRVFVWENRDYLHKLLRDTDFIETYSYVTETLCVQSPFCVGYAPLRERSEVKHSLLVRAGQDTVYEEYLVNSPPLPDAERVSGVLAYLRSRNERVKFKSSHSHITYDASGTSAERLTTLSKMLTSILVPSAVAPSIQPSRIPSDSSSHNSQTPRIPAPSPVHVSSKEPSGVSQSFQTPRMPTDAFPAGSLVGADVNGCAGVELSFDELDFSLDDGDTAGNICNMSYVI